MFGVPDTMLSTLSHDTHRKRRAPIAPYFSQQAIRRFDPVIRSKLEVMCSKFEEYQQSGQPANLDVAFNALTTDIITEYAFGISYGHLEAPGFNPDWLPLLKSASENSLLQKQMPWLSDTMRKIPLSLLLKLKPQVGHFVVFREVRSIYSDEFRPGAN